MSRDREEKNALKYIFNSLLVLLWKSQNGYRCQISLLSFTLSSLPHKATLTVSVQVCHSADFGGDTLVGTEWGRGPPLSTGHASCVAAGDLG